MMMKSPHLVRCIWNKTKQLLHVDHRKSPERSTVNNPIDTNRETTGNVSRFEPTAQANGDAVAAASHVLFQRALVVTDEFIDRHLESAVASSSTDNQKGRSSYDNVPGNRHAHIFEAPMADITAPRKIKKRADSPRPPNSLLPASGDVQHPGPSTQTAIKRKPLEPELLLQKYHTSSGNSTTTNNTLRGSRSTSKLKQAKFAPGAPGWPLSAEDTPPINCPGAFETNEYTSVENSTEAVRLSQHETRRECCVCIEELRASEFPSFKLSEICDHGNDVCLGCLSSMIQSDVKSKHCHEIECPSCRGVLKYEVVQALANKQSFEKYESNVLFHWKKAQTNLWYCPKSGCGFVGLHEGGEAEPIVTCGDPKCRFRGCFICKSGWHDGMTCSQWKIHQKDMPRQEKESSWTVNKMSEACPTCEIRIQKSGGCDHMKCSYCKTSFCYQCLAPWARIEQEGNTAHAPSCSFHTNNL